LWLLYLTVTGLAFSMALFYVFARYRFSLVPVLLLFAGAGLAKIPKVVQKRRISQLTWGLLALMAMAPAVRWPVLPPPGPGSGVQQSSDRIGKAGMGKEAIESYQHALELDPTSAATHYNMGSLLALAGELSQANDHLRKAVVGPRCNCGPHGKGHLKILTYT
jgi:hypothetical protein